MFIKLLKEFDQAKYTKLVQFHKSLSSIGEVVNRDHLLVKELLA